VVQSNDFNIGSDRWTTPSTRQFSKEDIGRWLLRVKTAGGDILHTEDLRYVVLNEVNRGRRESYRNMPCDIGGATLLSFATAYAPIARFEYLLQNGARLDKWHSRLMTIAVEGRNISLLRWLLQKDFDIDATFHEGHTALTLATETGDANMVLFLLQQGANIDVENRRSRLPPLAYATLHNHSLITRVLLEHGANPNQVDNDKFTVLARAAHACNAESTRMLLEYGADPEIADKRGVRPVDRADRCIEKGAWTAQTPEHILLRQASAALESP